MSQVYTSDLKEAFVDATLEERRLHENKTREKYWLKWGPYLSERAWATVREDYSSNGDAWSHFPFEHAASRAFRWGEDGIFGVSDNRQLICMSLALWNGHDPILKERLFGVTGPQGNHGEDVKELYYYIDSTPTHSYMKALYKYPFAKPFPYEELVKVNGERGYQDREFEVYEIDGLYQDQEEGDEPYFDVMFEMAKGDDNPNDLNFRITAYNRSNKRSGELYLIPQVFFRNTWGWCRKTAHKPHLQQAGKNFVKVETEKYGTRTAVFAPSPGGFGEGGPEGADADTDAEDIDPELLFTENESNLEKLFNSGPNPAPFAKDAFHDYIIRKKESAVNPDAEGTKSCAVYHFPSIPPGEYVTVRYKFTDEELPLYNDELVIDEEEFDTIFERREEEADNFYWKITPLHLSDELRKVQRQAFAGLMWSKQFYNFIQDQWYNGDPNVKPRPPPNRAGGRNKDWKHMYAEDILSLPDKWEYPFFASWDTAFHCIPIAMVDPEFAKKQLDLLTREWYMHPNGQMPAYEWNFGDVNPPVHAWAVYRVFKIERNMYKREDRVFLERVFQKLLLNFTWWVNRKDSDGNNVFEGGFLGLDNIGIFNRSEPLPTGGTLEQADSTGWMAFFSLQMLNIALELAKENPVYEDIASKFFEHFILISDAMSFKYIKNPNSEDFEEEVKESLWNDKDEFYYDAISWGDPFKQQLPIRSLVGLIPLYACMTLEPQVLERFPGFKKRVDWFIKNRGDIFDRNIASMERRGIGERLLLSLVSKDRLEAILRRMLDESEFLSDYGIRSLSKYHEEHPFTMNVDGQDYQVKYLPGESDSGMFGGNSNWRGPIWFPTNFLLIESLQRFFLYYGPNFKVECPVGSGTFLNLAEVAEELEHRLSHLFMPDDKGVRACFFGDHAELLSKGEHFKDLIPFFEYFDGDTGRGLGASHQCGWTALVAKWIHDAGVSCIRLPRTSRDSVSLSSIESQPSSPSKVPMPGRMARRKSTKSLVNLTATLLDLTEEEKRMHRLGNMPHGISPMTSNPDSANEILSSTGSQGEVNSQRDQEITEEEKLPSTHEAESKTIQKLKSKIKGFKLKTKADERADEDELLNNK
ncbi:LAMI_0C02190g1_1 [Lachancea mirantina]|uniref:Mannosyl-oligosaccharide glucosidase n=1 Tax=Lachancea mirantina TaxID=1230905 RepID=A0A1G4J0P0_9SACH|nr:LAMI_0C02190g1_1 [Lachancea mirantina]